MEFAGIVKPSPANPNRHSAHQNQLLWAFMFHDLRDWMQVLQLKRKWKAHIGYQHNHDRTNNCQTAAV